MSLMQPRCAGATLAQGKFPPDICQRCGADNSQQCADDEAYDAQIATADPIPQCGDPLRFFRGLVVAALLAAVLWCTVWVLS